MSTLHPELTKAISWARAHIAETGPVEFVLQDECPSFMELTDFAYLVGVDCASYREGRAIAEAEEAAQKAAFEAEQVG
jgi:hypothetical protein